MYLTKSIISTYISCPMKLLLSSNFPELATSPAMERGTLFHEEAKRFFLKINLNKEYTYNSFRSVLPEGEHFENFAMLEWDRYKHDKEHFIPVLTEQKITSENLQLRGTVDRVDYTDKYGYVVVEYKTGQVWRLSNYRRELCIYTMILNDINILPEKVKYIKCLWVDQKKLLFEKLKTSTINATNRRIEQVRNGIENGDFHKRINVCDMGCASCPFLSMCMRNTEKHLMEKYKLKEMIW